jgi:hypothetical protein
MWVVVLRLGLNSGAGGVAIAIAVGFTVVLSYCYHDDYDGGLGLVFKNTQNENIREGGREKGDACEGRNGD